VAEAAARAAPPVGARIALGQPERGEGCRVIAGGIAVRCARRAFRAFASCGDAEPELRVRWVAEPGT
jgi:hypothetical protein